MNEKERLVLTEANLIHKIHIFRGVQVMLDYDLAAIYGYETRYFNRQVNNNKERFDQDFMFQLSREEFQNLMCKNFTSSWGGTRKLPYAFTEQGIYMLMTVLKGEGIICFTMAKQQRLPWRTQRFIPQPRNLS